MIQDQLERDGSRWFVIYVKHRHEKAIASSLNGLGYEQFLPFYQRRTGSRTFDLPLFPGYVFCRFDVRNRLPVVRIPGVFSIVSAGGAPAPVEESEIVALRKAIGAGLHREPWPHLNGRRVRLDKGPLRGVEGIVVRSGDKGRLVLSVELLQRAVAVDIDYSWISVC